MTQTMEEGKNGNVIVDANGSWQSIRIWGQMEKLDPEQQVAFEILAATYVLTFYNDSSQDLPETAFRPFEEQKVQLKRFARQTENSRTPLRLFVTGPAGAGKCKGWLPVERRSAEKAFRRGGNASCA